MLKLTYFPFPGLNNCYQILKFIIFYYFSVGRAYTARVCLRIGNVPFENELLKFPEFATARDDPSSKSRFPLGQMPVLTLPSGKVITQSSAIGRYCAKLADLYPNDAELALEVDEVVDVISDIVSTLPQDSDQEIKKTKREEWAATKLKKFMEYLNLKVSASNGSYVVGGKLSLADISLYNVLNSLRSGNFDYVPTDYDAQWPAFASFFSFLAQDPLFGPVKDDTY